MANLNWKIGDTSPVSMTLGVDLSGATVSLNIYPFGQRTTPLASPAATVTDPASGAITLAPVTSLAAGQYTVEAVVSGAQGQRTTVSLTLVIGDLDQDVYPPDATTPVGQARILIGDVTYTADADDVFSYTYFTDAELATFLTLAGDNVKRAVGTAIKQLAVNAELTGISIKADDLSIDSRTRGAGLLQISASWIAEADADDANDAQADFMIVTPARNRQRMDDRVRYWPYPIFDEWVI